MRQSGPQPHQLYSSQCMISPHAKVTYRWRVVTNSSDPYPCCAWILWDPKCDQSWTGTGLWRKHSSDHWSSSHLHVDHSRKYHRRGVSRRASKLYLHKSQESHNYAWLHELHSQKSPTRQTQGECTGRFVRSSSNYGDSFRKRLALKGVEPLSSTAKWSCSADRYCRHWKWVDLGSLLSSSFS